MSRQQSSTPVFLLGFSRRQQSDHNALMHDNDDTLQVSRWTIVMIHTWTHTHHSTAPPASIITWNGAPPIHVHRHEDIIPSHAQYITASLLIGAPIQHTQGTIRVEPT